MKHPVRFLFMEPKIPGQVHRATRGRSVHDPQKGRDIPFPNPFTLPTLFSTVIFKLKLALIIRTVGSLSATGGGLHFEGSHFVGGMVLSKYIAHSHHFNNRRLCPLVIGHIWGVWLHSTEDSNNFLVFLLFFFSSFKQAQYIHSTQIHHQLHCWFFRHLQMPKFQDNGSSGH